MRPPEGSSGGLSIRHNEAKHYARPFLFPFHAQGSAGRCRRRESAVHDPRRHDQEACRRRLHLHADGAAHHPQDRSDHPRRNERGGRGGTLDADRAAGGALAGIGPLGEVRCRASAHQGPSRPRLRDPADVGGSHHRHRASGNQELASAPRELLSHPDEVPRRAPSPLRRDARPRIHDEGRVLVRP